MNKELESIINYYINNDVARDKVKDYIKELHNKIDKAIKFIEDDYYSKNTVDIDSVSIPNNKLIQIRDILRGDVDE